MAVVTATSTHRRRRLALVAVAALVAFVFGVSWGRGESPGPLHWDGVPRTGTAGDQQLLYGTLVSRAKRPVRVRSDAVRVVDGAGKRLTSAAAFSDGYVQAFAASARPATVVLRPGGRVPLGVTWTGDAATIEVAGSKLAVPK